jgi:RNA-directed DNA polymerase
VVDLDLEKFFDRVNHDKLMAAIARRVTDKRLLRLIGAFLKVGVLEKELTAYLRGWKSYFGFCQIPSLLQQLDQWIRHRLRSMIWKQWKYGKQRYAKLRHLGIGRDLAAQTAGSPHGPWHLANSPAQSSALPIAYFDSLGLARLFAGDA